jgi:hypothetical protein
LLRGASISFRTTSLGFVSCSASNCTMCVGRMLANISQQGIAPCPCTAAPHLSTSRSSHTKARRVPALPRSDNQYRDTSSSSSSSEARHSLVSVRCAIAYISDVEQHLGPDQQLIQNLSNPSAMSRGYFASATRMLLGTQRDHIGRTACNGRRAAEQTLPLVIETSILRSACNTCTDARGICTANCMA